MEDNEMADINIVYQDPENLKETKITPDITTML